MKQTATTTLYWNRHGREQPSSSCSKDSVHSLISFSFPLSLSNSTATRDRARTQCNTTASFSFLSPASLSLLFSNKCISHAERQKKWVRSVRLAVGCHEVSFLTQTDWGKGHFFPSFLLCTHTCAHTNTFSFSPTKLFFFFLAAAAAADLSGSVCQCVAWS